MRYTKHNILSEFIAVYKEKLKVKNTPYFLSLALISLIDQHKDDWSVMIIGREYIEKTTNIEPQRLPEISRIHGVMFENKAGARVYFHLSKSKTKINITTVSENATKEIEKSKEFARQINQKIMEFYQNPKNYLAYLNESEHATMLKEENHSKNRTIFFGIFKQGVNFILNSENDFCVLPKGIHSTISISSIDIPISDSSISSYESFHLLNQRYYHLPDIQSMTQFNKHTLLKMFKGIYKTQMKGHYLSFALALAIDKNKNDWSVIVISNESASTLQTESTPQIYGVVIENKQGHRVYFDMESPTGSTLKVEEGKISENQYQENEKFAQKIEDEILVFYNNYDNYLAYLNQYDYENYVAGKTIDGTLGAGIAAKRPNYHTYQENKIIYLKCVEELSKLERCNLPKGMEYTLMVENVTLKISDSSVECFEKKFIPASSTSTEFNKNIVDSYKLSRYNRLNLLATYQKTFLHEIHPPYSKENFYVVPLLKAIDKNKNIWSCLVVGSSYVKHTMAKKSSPEISKFHGIILENKEGARVYFDLGRNGGTTLKITGNNNLSEADYSQCEIFATEVEQAVLEMLNIATQKAYSSPVNFYAQDQEAHVHKRSKTSVDQSLLTTYQKGGQYILHFDPSHNRLGRCVLPKGSTYIFILGNDKKVELKITDSSVFDFEQKSSPTTGASNFMGFSQSNMNTTATTHDYSGSLFSTKY